MEYTTLSRLLRVLPYLLLITSALQAHIGDCNPQRLSTSEKHAGAASKDNTGAKEQRDAKPKEKVKPPKIGNFSLPTSQQPAALFGFGGNIIAEDEVQFYFFADDLTGKRKTTIDLIPSLLFGVTDDFSIFFAAPVTPLLEDGCHKSRGLEDFFIQLEYAFYEKSNRAYVDQATVVANITAPTGSVRKNPPTGFGSPTLFLGATYYRTWVDWFAFTSHGAILTTSDNGTKLGDQFLYQMGCGRNFPSPPGWIYAWMIEVDGQYSKKNRIHHIIDKNSGGSVLFVTPSIWFSSKEILLQFGVSFPVQQNPFGKQNKFDYVLNFNFACSFY